MSLCSTFSSSFYAHYHHSDNNFTFFMDNITSNIIVAIHYVQPCSVGSVISKSVPYKQLRHLFCRTRNPRLMTGKQVVNGHTQVFIISILFAWVPASQERLVCKQLTYSIIIYCYTNSLLSSWYIAQLITPELCRAVNIF